MTKRDKLIEKFLAEPPAIEFRDVCALLEMFGYIERKRKSGTSHHTFVIPGRNPITVPVHGDKVKRAYIRLIVRELDLEK